MSDAPADPDAPLPEAGTIGAQDDLEPVIGNYTLVERIGEGGFGVVYRAEQRQPVRREVALKVIKLGMDTKEVVARFAAERQALALMEHPNISQVFDAGSTRLGRPYFVMELVRGVPITEYCDDVQLDIAARLDLFLAACQAVHHAHQKGVIHRDIKPSNVLVTLHDGEAVPKIIDFGIAKATDRRLTEKTLFTEQHQMIGTPEYMAPEQADLSGQDVDTRADIYSLGVLLYELLTGTKPHDLKSVLKDGFGAVLEHIRDVDPPRPSDRVSTLDADLLAAAARERNTTGALLGKSVVGDLDWIVMKALEKDRARRYESASALAADIERYRNDEPVLARPPSRAYRLRKYIRRHRVGVAASCAVGLALIIGAVLALRGYLEAERQLARAQRAERTAQDEARDARTARAEADERAEEARLERDAKSEALKKVESAHAARKEALTKLGKALTKTDAALGRVRIMGLVHSSAVAEREDPMRALLLAREAARHASSAPVLTQLRRAIRISRERAQFRGHREAIHTVVLSPNGDYVLSASEDFIARLWKPDGSEVDFLSHNGPVHTAVFSPDGKRILTAAGGKSFTEGEARLWDLEGERLARLRGHGGHVFDARYSPSGDRILTLSWDGKARLWDADGKPQGSPAGTRHGVHRVVRRVLPVGREDPDGVVGRRNAPHVGPRRQAAGVQAPARRRPQSRHADLDSARPRACGDADGRPARIRRRRTVAWNRAGGNGPGGRARHANTGPRAHVPRGRGRADLEPGREGGRGVPRSRVGDRRRGLLTPRRSLDHRVGRRDRAALEHGRQGARGAAWT